MTQFDLFLLWYHDIYSIHCSGGCIKRDVRESSIPPIRQSILCSFQQERTLRIWGSRAASLKVYLHQLLFRTGVPRSENIMHVFQNGPLNGCAKLRVVHENESRGRFPRHQFQRKPRDGRAVIYVGIANPRGKRSRHSWRMRNPQFDVSGKRPMARR